MQKDSQTTTGYLPKEFRSIQNEQQHQHHSGATTETNAASVKVAAATAKDDGVHTPVPETEPTRMVSELGMFTPSNFVTRHRPGNVSFC
jgi:hypothetical protein